MKLHPTHPTHQLILASSALVALGTAARSLEAVSAAGAILIAVMSARLISLHATRRMRRAGFELAWTRDSRVTRALRGDRVELSGELRNLSDETVCIVDVAPIASSMLDVDLRVSATRLLPRTKATFSISAQCNHVGAWGIHGLSLEARTEHLGGDGLFATALLFAHPHGIEVHPRALATGLHAPPRGALGSGRSVRTGRSELALSHGIRKRGDGQDVRELRPLVPGDSFKRIAWKASARRGELMVRDLESTHQNRTRGTAWLVFSTSVGASRTALELAIEDAAGVAASLLANHNAVGTVLMTPSRTIELAPSVGRPCAQTISQALISAAQPLGTLDTSLTRRSLAVHVAEHLRPFDPHAEMHADCKNMAALGVLAKSHRMRAPFATSERHTAAEHEEEALVHYLTAFGIELPLAPTHIAEPRLIDALSKLVRAPDTDQCYVWARPCLALRNELASALLLLHRKHIRVSWAVPLRDTEATVRAESSHEMFDRAQALRDNAEAARAAASLRSQKVILRSMYPRRAVMPRKEMPQ